MSVGGALRRAARGREYLGLAKAASAPGGSDFDDYRYVE
jgi:hypothetical protein